LGRANAAQQARFLQKPELDLRVVREFAMQDLERDQRLQFLVPRL
jgi:hypothetical protein